jgi:hypothetical protein
VARIASQLTTGAGVAAKQLCSLEFVSGLDERSARALYLEDLLRGRDSMFHVDMDRNRQTVTVNVPLIASRLAVYVPGYGCTLIEDGSVETPAPISANPPSPGMSLDGSLVSGPILSA